VPLLAIETTCDETAAAVIDRSRRVLSSVVASQEGLHARFQGVVPELASRAHVERILPVIDEAVRRANVPNEALVGVAVAVRPGLAGSLLVGLSAAKGIATVLGVPCLGYDHVAAHLYACRIAHGSRMAYPAVGLVASGGHTSLFHLAGPLAIERLGGTIDDAAGEAFDKAAALLGLGYPGGPAIERAAIGGDPRAFRLPRPLANDASTLDMSFSGLKTALRYLVKPPAGGPPRADPSGPALADLAASFEQAAVDTILAKLALAVQRTGAARVAIGGGVACNRRLRRAIEAFGRERGVDVLMPPPEWCTDNAAMGAIAWERLERGDDDGLELDILAGTDRRSGRPPTAEAPSTAHQG